MQRIFSFALLLSVVYFMNATEAQAGPTFSYSFNGTVMDVIEGDLLSILHKGKLVQVRLSDVDCPETGQAFSDKAKDFSTMLVFASPVQVNVKELDRFGQAVAEVVTIDRKLNLNRELIKAGLAWWAWKRSDDMSYGDLEDTARQMKMGLWKIENPVPPWEYHLKKDGH